MLLLLACAAGPSLLLAPDASRSGLDGEPGPLGTAMVPVSYTARVTERVDADFVYPADGDAAPTAVDGGWPLVVFIHGAAVEPERYHWFASHLASRGYAVALPRHSTGFSLFESGNARVVRAGVAGDYADALSGAAAVAGHSMGGVSGVIDWVAEPEFAAIFLAASYPDPWIDPALRAGSPALSLVGTEDRYAQPSDVEAGADRFRPAFFGEITGMNHFDWTDDPLESELADDGITAGTGACRISAMRVADTFFDAALRGDADALARMEAGAFPGVEMRP